MNILILGAGGMLGHKLFQTLRAHFPDTCAALHGAADEGPLAAGDLFRYGNVLEHVNAADSAALATLLRAHQPQFVINCAGVVKQRAAAQDALPSIAINALLPHQLAALCAEWGGRLIHFSTDCVFSGRRGHYREDDQSDAEDLYGKTKYLGEVATENALTLRTSIIGRELTHFQSLLEWFLAQNHSRVTGYQQAFYSGVTTNHLAEIVSDIITDWQNKATLAGLFQIAGRTITKYDLLCLLREAYQLDIEIIPDDSFHCDRSLNGERFQQATGYEPPPWPQLVAQLAGDPTPYEQWRREQCNYSMANAS